MTDQSIYRHCELHKGNKRMVAWIPKVMAAPGKIVELNGDPGWHVAEVGLSATAEFLKRHERDFLNQRKASDA